MANTLTNLVPDLYAALDVVSRELTGFIPAVTLDANAARAAKDESIRVPIAPAAAAEDITPAMSVPAAANQTITNAVVSITKSRAVPFSWNGEEQKGVNNGIGYKNLRVNQIAQAMRTLVNEVEADLAALHATTSRAAGTAATTPFATTLAGVANVRKVLKDNGAPDDLQLVMDTTAGASLRTLGQVSKANEAGNDILLRQGELLNIYGMQLRESAQVVTSTAGAMASATSTNAAFTVGQTAIPLATAGTGVVAAGDVITFANDTNQYVVASVSFAGANPASGDTITLAEPGLRKAQSAATRAITVVAAAARNVGFSRSAIILVARQPARPEEGDLALDVMEISDPRSGLTFEVAMYPGNRMVRYEVSLAWGCKNIKPAHTALLLG
jgi:hypothetical protein